MMYLYLILLFNIYIIEGREVKRIQSLSIFSDNCCKGKSENYNKNIKNLEEESIILTRGKMKSFSIHRGLWSLSRGVNYSDDGVYYEGVSKSSGIENEEDILIGNCGSSAWGGGSGDFIQYKSIRYIGNTYIDLPGLSLFTDEEFHGKELYFDGYNLQLTSPHIFKSYGFTGYDSWTIFPYTNYTGGSSCLLHQNKPVSFIHKGIQLTVGSIKRGCTTITNGKEIRKNYNKYQRRDALILLLAIGQKVYTDSYELRIPIPLNIKNVTFQGVKNWTIYAGIEMDGRWNCLININYNPSHPSNIIKFPIGSVRRGCSSDPIPEIVNPPLIKQESQTRTGTANNIQLIYYNFLFVTMYLNIVFILINNIKY